MSAEGAPGWYGKVSMLGDFASRRLDADWVRSCDQWLSTCVQASQRALGERWLQSYLAAPVWRFAWAPQVIDDRWWFGVLLPSCDNVGRYFPLVIAQSRIAPPMDRIALDHLELWWSHIARAGLSTLADGATQDAFEDLLDNTPPWPGSGAGPWLRPGAVPGRQRFVVAPGAGASELAGGLAGAVLLHRLVGATLWWPVANPGEVGSCTLVQGLPTTDAFASLLTGEW
jgi:type VI secretion system protein ImpM